MLTQGSCTDQKWPGVGVSQNQKICTAKNKKVAYEVLGVLAFHDRVLRHLSAHMHYNSTDGLEQRSSIPREPA